MVQVHSCLPSGLTRHNAESYQLLISVFNGAVSQMHVRKSLAVTSAGLVSAPVRSGESDEDAGRRHHARCLQCCPRCPQDRTVQRLHCVASCHSGYPAALATVEGLPPVQINHVEDAIRRNVPDAAITKNMTATAASMQHA